MKKNSFLIGSTLLLIMLMTSVSFADIEKEIGIDVENPKFHSLKTSSSSSEIILGEVTTVAGGTLWSQFRGASHRGRYHHWDRVHRASATNSNGDRRRSRWENPGVTATSPWLASTLTGNRVWAAVQ